MTDMTLGIILSIKRGYNSYETAKENIKDFLCKYCGIEPKYYTDGMLTRALRDALCDYINSAGNPKYVLIEFFSFKHDGPYRDQVSETEAIISTLNMQQVRDFKDRKTRQGLRFINGFRQWYFDEDINLTLEG